ncbi:hypothetical protein RIF29_41638 [Crotalaria pallida]|uniref:PPM-type phosphatase domain-containing protein n=1 Tax=Crotalaria pallida TaxID=3830 RepID=A0AAN9HVI1_CROPI
MSDLFSSRSFHSLLVPCHNFPPKPSPTRIRISAPFSLPRQWLRLRMLASSTSPSSSSDTEDFDVLSSTVCSDGSVVFRFGNASEIREKVAELDQEKLACEDEHEAGVRALLSEGVENLNTDVDHNLGVEIDSSAIAVVGVAYQNLQQYVNEKESIGFDSDSKTNVIIDSQKVDLQLELNSAKVGQHGVLSEDVAARGCNDVLGVSEEDSEKESFALDNDSATTVIIDSQEIASSVKDDQRGILSEDFTAEGSDVASVSEEVSEKENFVLDNVSATTMINDSQEIDEDLKLDSAKDGENGILSENVAADIDDDPSTSAEDPEKGSLVLDNDSTTPVVNDSQEIDGHLKLDSTKDGENGILSEDVAADSNDDPSKSAEDPEKGSLVLDNNSTTPVVNDSQEIDEDLKLNSVKDVENGILSEDVAADINDDPSASEEDSEKESLVLDNDSATPVINDSQQIDKDLKLDSVKDGENLILSEDVAADGDDVPIASEEDSEKEILVLDNDPETPVINDSRKIDGNLKFDSAKDGENGILSEDVAAEDNDVLSASEEDSEVHSEKEIVVSEFAPESDMLSDQNSGASGELEEKADKGHDTDGATNKPTGVVDADLGELMPVSTSLESEQVANDEETTHHIADESNNASQIKSSAVLHDLVPSSDLENKIEMENTERSDYENPSLPTAPEIHSIDTATQEGEETSRTELFLITGAACLPHPSKALTGRQDAYFISRQNWLGVADGVGQWSLEGSNTGLYIRELMEKCEYIVSNYENIKPAEVLTRITAETQSPGSSAVLVAHFDGEALHAANVGNTGFVIIRDGLIFKKSTPMFHEFNFPLHIIKGEDPSEIIEGYKIGLNAGDVIIIATNGLFDNLYDQEIASIVTKSLQAGWSSQEIGKLMAMRAQEVGRSSFTRSPFADAAQAVGYVGYAGGKLDDVTVIVSLVQTR